MTAAVTPATERNGMRLRPGEARPAWVKPFPDEWMRRLREISPVTDRTSYLHPHWLAREECWVLEDCMPARMLTKDTITQLSTHWSALPKTKQMGRRRFVSDYKFWMFQTYRVEARPFWCLQGTQFITGGTPVSFTDREARILEASGQGAEPIPVGILPNVPFDERVVQAILARDRLLKAGGHLDRLEKENRPEHQRAADAETERMHRQEVLKWNNETNAPMVEFMKWYRHQEEYKDTMRPAPEGLANDLTDWKDRYVETGVVGTGTPRTRALQIAVR